MVADNPIGEAALQHLNGVCDTERVRRGIGAYANHETSPIAHILEHLEQAMARYDQTNPNNHREFLRGMFKGLELAHIIVSDSMDFSPGPEIRPTTARPIEP